jgi:hypothetical protein
LHRQFVAAVAAAPEYEFAGQLWQASVPVVALKVPSTQLTHDVLDELGRYWPSEQVVGINGVD